eukprot:CAMPEP_0114020836 /NCGR_PEP_ID=MMETSP0372-20130328/17857_1 /TAXON_ID=340204 /ORGANISM="Lankesteria abbotti" /LENGTH=48 /assembly_acc=CAM_ASM_000359
MPSRPAPPPRPPNFNRDSSSSVDTPAPSTESLPTDRTNEDKPGPTSGS